MTLGFVYIHPELFQEKKMFTPVHTVIFRIKINLNLGDRPENKKKRGHKEDLLFPNAMYFLICRRYKSTASNVQYARI